MFDTIYIPAFYAEYDKTGITEFLNRMGAKGWILGGKSGVLYKFQKTDKPYIIYDITWFADATKENDWHTYENDIYYEMARRAEWQFLTNDRKMMIFITENPDAVSLDTDPLVQINTIHRAMKKNYMPSYIQRHCATAYRRFYADRLF